MKNKSLCENCPWPAEATTINAFSGDVCPEFGCDTEAALAHYKMAYDNLRKKYTGLLDYIQNGKVYRYGMYIGRFQPLHNGHCDVIRKALNVCQKVVIVIGSIQEVYTRKNPFSYEDRKRFIEKVFANDLDRLIIIGLEDRKEIKNDESWGEYVYDKVKEITGLIPDVVFEGEEIIRSHWYDTLNIKVEKINRGDINVSATEVREALYQNEYNKVKAYLPNELMEYYEFMRERIQICYR